MQRKQKSPGKKKKRNPEDPKQMTWQERRTEIFGLVIQAGLPSLVDQTGLALHYGVNKSTISRDIAALGEELRKGLTDEMAGKIHLMVEAFYQGGIKQYVKRGKYDKAAPLMRDFMAFLFNTGKMEKAPDRLTGSIGVRRDADIPLDEEEITALSEIALERLQERKRAEREREVLDAGSEEEDDRD